jgi:hypothetical protein
MARCLVTQRDNFTHMEASFIVRFEYQHTKVYSKFPEWVDNEMNKNKDSLKSNTKGYGDKTH